jgi:cellulose synthase/poly-beta-1,6-N-acetylglucosamine synthase-like glycosyltransferase
MPDSFPLISIIILARNFNDYLKQAVSKCLGLDYGDFEILISTEEPFSQVFEKTMVIQSQEGPALRRDLAAKQAKGEILAFLDDDAYPQKDWLKNAVPYFKNPRIAAVCGPGITPKEDSSQQKASGWIFASLLGGGTLGYRFLPKKKREVRDFPSMNFLVRKSDFEKVGGFNSAFWPGEDTKLCLDLTKKLGKKIIYDPKILVFHHRRPVFGPHLEQVCGYGLHRGYFAKILPQTSKKPLYFMPLAFTFFVLSLPIFGLFAVNLRQPIFNIYFQVLGFYFSALALTGVWVFLKEKNLKIGFWTMIGIFLTHICYGLCFLRGLLAPKVK